MGEVCHHLHSLVQDGLYGVDSERAGGAKGDDLVRPPSSPTPNYARDLAVAPEGTWLPGLETELGFKPCPLSPSPKGSSHQNGAPEISWGWWSCTNTKSIGF